MTRTGSASVNISIVCLYRVVLYRDEGMMSSYLVERGSERESEWAWECGWEWIDSRWMEISCVLKPF